MKWTDLDLQEVEQREEKRQEEEEEEELHCNEERFRLYHVTHQRRLSLDSQYFTIQF